MSAKNQDSQPSGGKQSVDQASSSQNGYQTLWQTNEPIDVDDYEPVRVKEESLPIITKVESISDQIEVNFQPTNSESETITKEKAIKDVCELLGFNGKQPLQKLKEEFRKKFSKTLPDTKSDSRATICKSIYVTEMPLWFEFLHLEALIELNSDFDVDCGSYFIDMFKNAQNKKTDKCLIRFMKSSDCLQVFKVLSSIDVKEGTKKMVVRLDLDHKVTDDRDKCNPFNFEEQLRIYNQIRAQHLLNSGQTTDIGAIETTVKDEIKKEESDDDIEFIEPETTDLTQDDETESAEPSSKPQDNKPVVKHEPEEQIAIKREDRITIKDEDYDIDLLDDILNDTISYDELEQAPQVSNEGNDGCRIVHVKNLDKTKTMAQLDSVKIPDLKNLEKTRSVAFYNTINDLIKNVMGSEVKYLYRKVMDDNRKHSGQVLLQFETHKVAETVCKLLNKVTTPMVSEGVRIEAVMGVAYNMKRNVTTTDLKMLALKRKLDCDTNSENGNDAKRTRYDNSSSTSSVTAKNYSTGCMNVDERNFTAYGLSKEFMTKHGIKLPFSRAVIVKKLHPDVTEAKLLEVFSLAGEVKKVDFKRQHLHEAIIEYDHPLEAVQAISMFDNQKLYNQRIFVKMDELPRRRILPEGLNSVGPGLGKNGQPLRGLRIEAEMRKFYEMFSELGKVEKQLGDKTTPFKFIFKYPYSKDSFKRNVPARASPRDTSREKTSANNSTFKASNAKPSGSSTSSDSSSKAPQKDAKANEDSIPESTVLGIQALGNFLVQQGHIPSDTNCKSLQNILTALQKKTVEYKKPLLSLPHESKTNMGTDGSVSTTNRPSNTPGQNIRTLLPTPGTLNLMPNQINAFNQALDNVMQFITPQTVASIPVQPNMPQNFQNMAANPGNFITPQFSQALVPTNFNPSVPNVPQVQNISVPLHSSSQLGNRQLVPLISFGPRVNPPLPPPTLVISPLQPNQNPKNLNHEQPRHHPPGNELDRSNLREVPTQPVMPLQSQSSQSQPAQSHPAQSQPLKKFDDNHPQKPRKDSSNEKDSNDGIQSNLNISKDIERKSEMLSFKHLPQCVTTDILLSKMREVGEVKFCEVTGRGRAFVRFKYANDADRCIRLFHHSKVDGQVIDVSYL